MSEPRRDDVVLIASTLYSIVAGLAITTAIGALLTGTGGTAGNTTVVLSPLDLVGNIRRTLVVLSFFLFAIPFYHGATLALATSMRSSAREGVTRPLIDFFALFLEAGILYALSLSVNSLNIFLSWTITLLITDIVWATIGQRSHIIPATLKRALRWWILLDSPVTVFFVIFRLVIPIYITIDEDSRVSLIFMIALVRTALDYGICRDFYFARRS